jgi:hypothetical protein
MSTTLTFSETRTFTVTHARHIAAKVATDLKRMQRLYGQPSDTSIANYEAEAIELIRRGYLETVAYGFRRSGKWIEPTIRYTAKDLAGSPANDDDPGRIRPGASIEGASFYSFLTYNAAWAALSSEEREDVRECIPLRRGDALEPQVEGCLVNDRIYSSGGRALERASVRSY